MLDFDDLVLLPVDDDCGTLHLLDMVDVPETVFEENRQNRDKIVCHRFEVGVRRQQNQHSGLVSSGGQIGGRASAYGTTENYDV